MSRGKASGYILKRADAPIIMGMIARGDRDHDIAAGKSSGLFGGSILCAITAWDVFCMFPESSRQSKEIPLRSAHRGNVDRAQERNRDRFQFPGQADYGGRSAAGLR